MIIIGDSGLSGMEVLSLILSSGVLGTVFGFIKWYLPYRKNKENQLLLSGLRSIQNIGIQLDKIRSQGFNEAIVFNGHDTGNLPSPTNPYYLSSIFWSVMRNTGKPSRFEIDDFKKIRLGVPCINLLLDLYHNKKLILDTEKMENSILKTFYESNKLRYTAFIFLGIKDKNLYFLSASKSDEEITEEDIRYLELMSQSIINEFNF